MSADESPRKADAPPARPRQVRLPGFIAPGTEVGLGDVVKRATTAAGLRPCGGCAQRAEALNRRIIFTR